jgi:membrane protease YdiL (CAAX protease family)
MIPVNSHFSDDLLIAHPTALANAGNDTHDLTDGAIKCVAAYGLMKCGLEWLHSSKPARVPIASFKQFALGCGIGFGNLPLNLAVFSVFIKIIPPESGKSQETQAYLDAVAGLPSMVIGACPLLEELAFRKTVLEEILHEAVRFGLQISFPNAKNLLDSKMTMVYRIGITALLYGAVHLPNEHSYPRHQMIMNIYFGVLLGALKESKLGLPGAIGAHVANNAAFWAIVKFARHLLKPDERRTK